MLSSKVAIQFFHYHQQQMRIPLAPHSCQHLVLSVFGFYHSNNYVVLSLCYINLHFSDDNLYAECIMRNAGMEEEQAGIKIAGRTINDLR